MNLFRDDEKRWEEIKEFKKSIITENKLVQNEILGPKNNVESLTNRMMAA